MVQPWKQRSRPARLERRLEFEDYEATREFLDKAAELSEKRGIYPDLSFGRTYVNITLHADEGDDDVSTAIHDFASALDCILEEKEAAPDGPTPLRGIPTSGS